MSEQGIGTAQAVHPNGLSVLAGENFHEYFPSVMGELCKSNIGGGVDWMPVPKAHEMFNRLPVRCISKRKPDGTKVGRKGYIWVDTDRMQLLFNKTDSITSCHHLEDGEYKTGNFTYIYHNSVAVICAGKNHPKENLRHPKNLSGDHQYLYAPGQPELPIRVRPFIAVANLFLMQDEDRNPYLFANRLYDSGEGYDESGNRDGGWQKSVYGYLKAHCRRNGWGLAVAGEYWRSNICEKEPWKGTVKLCSPPSEYPYESTFGNYADGNINHIYNHSLSDAGITVTASLAVRPDKSRPGYVEMPPAHFIMPRDAGYDRNLAHMGSFDIDNGNSRSCDNCGCRVHDDEVYYTPADDVYCDTCFGDSCFRCEWCRNVQWNDDAYEGPGGDQYCECCFNSRYYTCSVCDEPFRKGNQHEFEGEYYCPDCYEDKIGNCDTCHEAIHNDNLKEMEDGRKVCLDCEEEVEKEIKTKKELEEERGRCDAPEQIGIVFDIEGWIDERTAALPQRG